MLWFSSYASDFLTHGYLIDANTKREGKINQQNAYYAY